jgi:hypothetical protein
VAGERAEVAANWKANIAPVVKHFGRIGLIATLEDYVRMGVLVRSYVDIDHFELCLFAALMRHAGRSGAWCAPTHTPLRVPMTTNGKQLLTVVPPLLPRVFTDDVKGTHLPTSLGRLTSALVRWQTC